MTDYKDLELAIDRVFEAIDRSNRKTLDIIKGQPANVGYSLVSGVFKIHTGRPHWIYIRYKNKEGIETIGQALNRRVTPKMNLPIRVQPIDLDKKTFWVLGEDEEKVQDSLDSPVTANVPMHSHRFGFSLLDMVEPERIEVGQVYVKSGLTLGVKKFRYYNNLGDPVTFDPADPEMTPGADEVSVSGSVPSTSGQHRYAVVVVHRTTGVFSVANSAEKPKVVPLTATDLDSVNIDTNVYEILTAVRLIYGDTAITDYRRFVDAKIWLAKPTIIASALVVSDGTTDVDPSSLLDFDPDYFDVTDLGGEAAGVTFTGTADLIGYTPLVGGDYPEGVPDDIAEALDILAARTGGGLDATDISYTATDTNDWPGTDPINVQEVADVIAFRMTVAEDAIDALTTGGIPSSGWVSLGQTLTYTSADGNTFVATCSGADVSDELGVGRRLRVSQSTGGIKYFIVTDVTFSTDTVITLFGGTDYVLENEAISSPYFSPVRWPDGFPESEDKWSVEYTSTADNSQSSPTVSVWYNPGTMSISMPIGQWKFTGSFTIFVSRASSTFGEMQYAFSSSNSSVSDAKMHRQFQIQTAGTATHNHVLPVTMVHTITAATRTTYYLIIRAGNASTTTIAVRGASSGTTVLRLTCAYL